MSDSIINEKTENYLKKIGSALAQHREIVCQDNTIEFAKRMTTYTGQSWHAEDIELMELGKENIPLSKWITVWIYFQNIDKIINACEQKDILYLAAQKTFPDIEQEIIQKGPKG